MQISVSEHNGEQVISMVLCTSKENRQSAIQKTSRYTILSPVFNRQLVELRLSIVEEIGESYTTYIKYLIMTREGVSYGHSTERRQ